MEFLSEELAKAGIGVATHIIQGGLDRVNQELLERKRKRLEDQKKKCEDDVRRIEGRMREREHPNENEQRERNSREQELNALVECLSNLALEPHECASATLPTNENELIESVALHLDAVKRWADTVSFSDLHGTKRLQDIYIELNTYVSPLRLHVDQSERHSVIPLHNAVFGAERHCIVVGQPGAGKSTSMRRLCNSLLTPTTTARTNTLPVLVRFRDLKGDAIRLGVILDAVVSTFSLRFDFSRIMQDVEDAPNRIARERKAVLAFLDRLAPIIVLDGLDEYPVHTRRAQIIEEFRSLCATLRVARIVLTCRAGEFEYHIPDAGTYEIAPLTGEQISGFAHKWIGSPERAEHFLEAVRTSPFADTAIKPLSLAHLCAIYERIGKIPDRPKTVYRKIVGLLLEEWDEQRSVKRQSAYSRFDADRKFEFLCHLAYYFTVIARTSVFTRAQFLSAYEHICRDFRLDPGQAVVVAKELESHTGLFLQSGYASYEFAHKSIQEYLTAEYLVKLPTMPQDQNALPSLGAELAVAVAISSNPSAYFVELGINVIGRIVLPRTFFTAFLTRLLQERPDFYRDECLIISALNIMTRMLQSDDGSSAVDRRVGYAGRDLVLFERLCKELCEVNSIADIYAFYSANENKLTDSDTVYLSRLRTSAKGYKLPLYLLVPGTWHAANKVIDA